MRVSGSNTTNDDKVHENKIVEKDDVIPFA